MKEQTRMNEILNTLKGMEARMNNIQTTINNQTESIRKLQGLFNEDKCQESTLAVPFREDVKVKILEWKTMLDSSEFNDTDAQLVREEMEHCLRKNDTIIGNRKQENKSKEDELCKCGHSFNEHLTDKGNCWKCKCKKFRIQDKNESTSDKIKQQYDKDYGK